MMLLTLHMDVSQDCEMVECSDCSQTDLGLKLPLRLIPCVALHKLVIIPYFPHT